MEHRPLRLIQISDCHLLDTPGERLHGWDNQAALAAVLAHVARCYPAIDAVLLTGDLVHDETAAGYRRLAAAVQRLGAPLLAAIPGNHDDPAGIRSAMPGVATAGPLRLGPWRLHLLDSRIPGSDAGRVGAEALAALRADLAAHPEAPTLVAVHHPPVPVGAAWLDAMRLADGEALLELLQRQPQARALLCGHVHQAFEARRGPLRLLTAPAVTRQFAPGSDTFAEDHRRVPGYRALRLFPDGRVTARIRRVPEAFRRGCA